MLQMLAQNWWIFAVRGVAAILFGVLAFLWPGPTVIVLALLFGAYALVDGVVLLVSLIRGDPAARRNAWAVGIMGVLGVAAGIVSVLVPEITAVALLYVVAAWSIVLGIMQIIAAIRLRREIEGELWMGLSGLISLLFGLYLAIFPGAGLVSLAWLVGIWAVIFGVFNLMLAFRLRGRSQGRQEPRPA
jgi:uncharacterized membrane protein HdeD (DUF308 family)